MLTTQEAQANVEALAQEAAALEAARLQLEQEQAAHAAKLDAAYIAAERTPTPQAQREANQLEAAANLLSSQLRRKRVALESVNTDLAEARATLERAKKAEAVIRLESAHTELVTICATLDVNMTDYSAWVKLQRVMRQSQQAWYVVRESDETHRAALYPDLRAVLNRTIEAFQYRLDMALNPTVQRGTEIKFATVGDAAEVAGAAKRIAHLRHVHIDAVATLHVDALEAVPA